LKFAPNARWKAMGLKVATSFLHRAATYRHEEVGGCLLGAANTVHQLSLRSDAIAGAFSCAWWRISGKKRDDTVGEIE
jgi:hypothetical protein